MDNALGADLHLALDQQNARRHHRAAVAFKGAFPQYDVGGAAFILDRDENRFAIARALAHQHHPGGADPAAIARCAHIGAAHHPISAPISGPISVKAGSEQRHGVGAQAEPQQLIIRRHLLAQRHGG